MSGYALRKAVLPAVILGFICLVTIAANDQVEEDPSSAILFKQMAVAPILVGQRQPDMDETLDDTLSCPINQICAEDPNIQADAGQMIMRLVLSELKSRFGRHIVPSEQVQAAYAGLRLDDAQDTPRTLAHRLGQSLTADLMMVGTVWRYRDRGAIEGFPDKPASVAFALYLVDPVSGRRLWRGVYDEAQELALQDMSKFTERIKMGLKWLTADELARHGVKEVLKPFPRNIMPLLPEDTEGKETQ